MGALAIRAPKPSIREYEAIKNPVPIEKNNVEKHVTGCVYKMRLCLRFKRQIHM